MSTQNSETEVATHTFFSRMMRFWMTQKLLVFVGLITLLFVGLAVAPFDWELPLVPRNPVPVDAIPDIGENQQIVFTNWTGRSPRDVEDQITYPLTVQLLGIPGVKSIRSYSYFGFSTIYVVFEENIEFYWSRTRILERLNSLQPGVLPVGVQPALGPDATAVGQVFWYTVEGKGFSREELRTIEDWYVRYYLQSARGVSEVASVGGYVKEYQIDVNPNAMRAHGVMLQDVYRAVQKSNLDVGARTIELNNVDYMIRGLGFIRSIGDLETAVVKVTNNVPLYVKDVGKVSLGPAFRQGALNKAGAEAVGGVVVVRFAENPLQVIKNVKAKIEEVAPFLPKKTLPDGSVSQVKIVPFYDRTQLIHETLGTLKNALTDEILVAIIVVVVMVNHLVSSGLISLILPLAVLMTFMTMKTFGVDANIMALSGIAIAIGVMVDMGIILCENILRHIEHEPQGKSRFQIVHEAATEVGGAVMTSAATTIIAFLPVFTLTGPEGKLFKPVAFTKTFAIAASLLLALSIIPPLAHILFTKRNFKNKTLATVYGLVVVAGFGIGYSLSWPIGMAIMLMGVIKVVSLFLPEKARGKIPTIMNLVALVLVVFLLAEHWMPLGVEKGLTRNMIFAAGIIFVLLAFNKVLTIYYPRALAWALDHKATFLTIPISLVIFGLVIWLGFDKVFSFIPAAAEWTGIVRPTISVEAKETQQTKTPKAGMPGMSHDMGTGKPGEAEMPKGPIRETKVWRKLAGLFPGLGKEFMPHLEEGSFLYMPTLMPHASIGVALDILAKQNLAIKAIPEIQSVVGKIGRVESALDPAPISMVETIITVVPEYKMEPEKGHHEIDPKTGKPIRNWRPEIKSMDDIWDEIAKAAHIPGVTMAPKLQPIATRVIMLQTGMRSAMGVKIRGNSLEDLEKAGLQIEKYLREVPSIEPSSVIADRLIGAAYLEIVINREAIARYGVNIQDVNDVIEIAIGGRQITTTVEGRERFPVRVRYDRELRDSVDALRNILIPAVNGAHIPMNLVAQIEYVRGPMVIKSEDTFLVSYVIFDKKPGVAEVNVVQDADNYLKHKIMTGELKLAPNTSYWFAGAYENQVRSEKTMMIVIPATLLLVFLILYFQFRSIPTSLNVFSGIFVAWSGGFLLIWLYSQPWFLDFSIFGVNMRHLFQVRPYNLSVAVWVGFLALFGIATNDGVIYSTYLDQVFEKHTFHSVSEIREATVEAGIKRIRPALMTASCAILALIPVLTSTGRGSDVMVPMALPTFGGMLVATITIFVVPTIYCLEKEIVFKRRITEETT
ncbi:efflux RND transporter permease subunit [Desulfomonile tiedjei]|uniref:Putative silver efflux pump n=1 Tax=Desulfomonile tiedjei (strain ATCC 49306 / DSM 6799 / DCB-1) TaxID=706587 RepID=I4C5W7_DESTA|nr:efflux RND transporter permease subunit [Desulfomonile tiedjei]AFM24958.1 putative silver efflux pump [Desulfomonile tiedjei DSM 6799]